MCRQIGNDPLFFDSDPFVFTQLTNLTCQGAIISNYYFHFWISATDQKYTNIQFESYILPMVDGILEEY